MNLKKSKASIVFQLETALIFLTILFLPTQLGKHFWPPFAYIYSLRIDYLSPTIYFWDFLVLSLTIVWILKPVVNSKALSIFLIFLLSQAASIITSSNIGAGVVRIEQYLTVGLMGVYLASQKFTRIKKPLILALGLGVVFEGGLAICQFLLGKSLGFWIFGERSFSLSTPSIANFNFYGQIFLRPYGTFPHPNVLAAFMVLSLPLINFMSSSRFISMGLGSLATLLSFSRSAILVLLIEVLLIFKNRRSFLSDKMKWLFLILILISPLILTRFSSAFNFDNLSIIRREELSIIALTQFSQSPLVGVGLNNFISGVATSGLIAGPSRFLQPVHNIFLLNLAETGIIGFLGLVILMGFPMLRLWRARDQAFPKVLLLSWFSILFLGVFDHYFLTLPQGQRLLFLIWGLSMLEFKK